MSARGAGPLADLGGGFTEHAPRPPVPGEEGELVSSDARLSCPPKPSAATPRCPDLDLGYEPEGSASPTPPYLRWAESLHSLLDDQDGILLFRAFLQRERRADLLDFWFACSGFRKLEPGNGREEERKLKLAKAIYRKYVLDNGGVVSRKIKPATKSFVRDCVTRLRVDPAMFDQAQIEIQTAMEEDSYPSFLKSDLYMEYTRMGGESPRPYGDSGSGNGATLAGDLPTQDEENKCTCVWESRVESGSDHAPTNQLTPQRLKEVDPQRLGASKRSQDSWECRHSCWREPPSAYCVDASCGLGSATSTSDSQQHSLSSDAAALSLTDCRLDGVRGCQKHQRQEVYESGDIHVRVPLPHVPRTLRVPKSVHVDPQRFAAELIRRLERVLRERETQRRLQERLRCVRLEEEGDDADISAAPSVASRRYCSRFHPSHHSGRCLEPCGSGNGAMAWDAHEEDPESILDEHVQRVMKTPDCHSPKSPASRSPDGLACCRGLQGCCPLRTDPWHHRHGHVSHTGGPRSASGPAVPETLFRAPRGHVWPSEPHPCRGKPCCHADIICTAFCGSRGHAVNPCVPPQELDRTQKIIKWIMQGEEDSGRRERAPYGLPGDSRRSGGHEGSWPSSVECPGTAHRLVQPSHPFIQDPTMPPNPTPHPLTQLEEVRRRLEEGRGRSGTLQARQRYVMEVIQRGRAAVWPAALPPLDSELIEHQYRSIKQPSSDSMVVAYYFCGEPIPYRTTVKGSSVTLSQFKGLLTKKGSYRYYFKKVSDEFDCGVVFEEVREDSAVLPVFEEKIVGKVEKVD